MSVPGRPLPNPGHRSSLRGPLPAEITSATLEAIRRKSVDGFTLSDVEERTRIDAASIRQRWGDKAELAVRALSAQWENAVPLPDTGSLREDMATWTRSIARYLSTSSGRSFMRLLVVDDHNWGSGDARAEFWETRYQRVDQMFERAERRGEIRPGVDGNMLTRMMMAPLHAYALYFEDAIIEDETVNAIIDMAWNGIAATALRPSQRPPSPAIG